MSNMLPSGKPQLAKSDAQKMIDLFDHSKYPTVLLGVRGYFKKTMGDPTKNDRNLYDDGMFIISADHYSAWNGNTDPSAHRKGIAVLKANAKRNADGTFTILNPNPYLYKVGLHGISGPHPYEAFRQYGRVTVIRDGGKEETDTDRNPFWIDIHRGGYGITSSLGCQTIWPDQYEEYLKTGKTQMKLHSQDIIPYWLVEY